MTWHRRGTLVTLVAATVFYLTWLEADDHIDPLQAAAVTAPLGGVSEAPAARSSPSSLLSCRSALRPVKERGQFELVAVDSFACPLIDVSAVPACRSDSPGWPLVDREDRRLKLQEENIERQITDAIKHTSNRTVPRSVEILLRATCTWPKVESTKQLMEPWVLGERLRRSFDVQRAVDCFPSVPATTHHLHTGRFGDIHEAVRSSLQPPHIDTTIRDVPKVSHLRPLHKSTHDNDTVKAYRAASFPGKTLYFRRHKASYIRIDNVCMSCESVKRKFFTNPRRPCIPTLWSIGETAQGLEATARGGRHAIFVDREGGFQYGGSIDPPRGVPVMRGTTFYVAPFENDNVGHIIHDAAWSTFSSIFLREKAEFPKPYTAMIDDHFFNCSSLYFAFLALGSVLSILGNEKLHESTRQLNAWQSLVLSPVSAAGAAQPLVCFETLVATGIDRNGHSHGRLINRYNLSSAFRQHILSFVGLPPALVQQPSSRQPRVFVYGRNEVYRRRINNIGALASALRNITDGLGLSPPIVVTSLYMHPAAQIELFSGIDILVTMQGAHLEQSLFMPIDGALIEISDCRNKRLSFVSRYRPFHEQQSYKQHTICHSRINLSAKGDSGSQDIILCPHHLREIAKNVATEISRIRRVRHLN